MFIFLGQLCCSYSMFKMLQDGFQATHRTGNVVPNSKAYIKATFSEFFLLFQTSFVTKNALTVLGENGQHTKLTAGF